jgi:hypothetical protein
MTIPRCILHIGWHKTGSTALQAFLGPRSPALAKAGFHYPAFKANHSDVLVSAIAAPDRVIYAEHFTPASAGYQGQDRKTAARRILRDLLDPVDDATLVLSGEDLCLLDFDAVQRLHTALHAVYDDITVVAYLRNHADYARSALQQLLRMGFQAEDIMAQAQGAKGLLVLTPLPDYAHRVDIWRTVCGTENVMLCDYDALVTAGQSIEQHFTDTWLQPGLYAQLSLGHDNVRRTDQAFSAPAAYIMQQMNRAQPLMRAGTPNPGFVFNRQGWLSDVRGAPVALPSELAEPVAAAIRADAALFRAAGKVAVLTVATDFAKPVTQMFSGDDLLDDVARALDKAIGSAVTNLAREKFFAFLPKLQDQKQRAEAVAQMHVALFLLPDLARLISCGFALHAVGELALARAFAAKAVAFEHMSPNLKDLMARIAESGKAAKSGSP